MSIAELLALADIVKNETGIGRNNAVRIGMALEEIIKYFRDNGGSGGEPGSADGGVLESISAMNFAPQGKFYGVQLPENHPELGIDHFSLICMRGGSQEELIQVAIGYDGTAQKLWLRGGEVNSYGAFNQISGIDGETPHIGGNGNWFIGATDTGVKAAGTDGAPGTILTADQLQIINTVPLICSDEKTDLTASTTEAKIRFVFQNVQSFTKIVGELNTAATGGTLTVVAKKNGVSFMSTNLTFDSGDNTTRTASTPFMFTTPTVSFAVGDYVEIFITSVGAVTPGKGLKIYLM